MSSAASSIFYSPTPSGALDLLSVMVPPPVFAPEELGLLLIAKRPGTDSLPPSVTVDVSLAAEGPLVIGRCACGGRAEVLLDIRNQPNIPIAERLVEALGIGVQAATHLIEPWIRRHRRCATVLAIHAADPQVHALAESSWAAATDSLADGIPVQPLIHVLMDTGGIVHVPVEVPLDPVQGRILEQIVAYTVREFARRQGMRAVGAVCVTESWLSTDVNSGIRPSNNPRRQEGLVLLATTPTRGVLEFATVSRLGGIREHGPATVGERTDNPQRQRSMLDGLLAVSVLQG